jgi:hypothetical protein
VFPLAVARSDAVFGKKPSAAGLEHGTKGASRRYESDARTEMTAEPSNRNRGFEVAGAIDGMALYLLG